MMMKKVVRLSLVLCASVFISGCTFFNQGDDLPSRDSIRAGEEVTVERNENVYAIARKHGVSMREIIVLNDLKPPYKLQAGQRITLPLNLRGAPKVPSAAPLSTIEKAPLEPINSSVTSEPLAPVSPVPLAQNVQKPLETTVASNDAQPLSSQPVQQPVTEKPAEKTVSDTSFSAIPPVQGPIISPFGAKGQGMSNDGINIGAPKGSSVVAAAGGMVVYAGNEMKGFGNLILIRHEGGWVTAYAHLERMLVSRDAIVAAGDMIGTVGTTGGVSAPQLHFETRLEGKPVDPQTVLRKTE